MLSLDNYFLLVFVRETIVLCRIYAHMKVQVLSETYNKYK